ncbi:sigma-70 family RNA polymerase sigma factor [Schlesneria paludicola]|uniref:sigma-70 family RNA polymerase sigma factor n=1 Tax=Schlesneria paludicola TaxID=360056 RepID=UPI00029A0075|nr:sigma-70 family RNA polymerase sigma factor [Schlesneria paludicola]
MSEQICSRPARKPDHQNSTSPPRRSRSRQPIRGSAKLIETTRHLMERTIEFIPHPNFDRSDCAEYVESLLNETSDAPHDDAPATAGIAFVTGLVSAARLTVQEERYWFTKMNFLKFRAEQHRRLLDLRHPDQQRVDGIQADLWESQQIRNRIVQANLRLIVALAKKLSHSLETMSELISEGTTPLIRAVELFDVHLGNRFSTYATWAARNQMLRWLKRNRSALEGASRKESPSLESLPDKRPIADAAESERPTSAETVNRLMSTLSERERTIVAARFGLDGQPHSQSLAEIAKQMDLSKERVRQIALASLEKLREYAVNQEGDIVI